MVYLTPRFLFLAALVATAAMPTFVVQSNARAVDLMERHHDKSSHDKQSASSLASKGRNKVQSKPTIPLPPSAKTVKGQGKKSEKHRKAGRKHERDILASKDNTWDPLDPVVQVAGISVGDGRGGSFSDTHDLIPSLASILRRDPESEHHHHHHHHHHGRQEQEAQTTFSLHRRTRSRIYGKRERKIEEIEKQEMPEEAEAKTAGAENRDWDMFDPLLKVGNFEIGDRHHGSFSDTRSLLPRSPAPHHHHHHHGYHDKVVVNGDDDKVHVHERRDPHHHHHHHHHGDHDRVIVNGNNDKVHVHERREPHHHHHHHGHHVHDKTVINGDNDDVHIHERRDPRHHHHHHGEHKTVINGDNDNVHIHNRGVDSYDDILDVYLGLDMCGSSINGHKVECNIQSGHQKRSAALENMPGVPGTVDIMAVGGNTMEKLASLILSSAPDNSSTTDISGSLNDSTKAADDTNLSPFVLDASNSTQTQFFLVAAETAPSVPSAPSTSFSNTLSVLKSAASSKDDEFGSQDIKVTLQVLVFEPSEAAMRPYCATFDPNPPAPAALTMDKCFSDSSSQNTGKMTETSLHKSQTFLYNPTSGVLRPKWFEVTGDVPLNATEPSASVPIPSNGTSTSSSSSSNSSPSATSGASMDAKQMNFKIPTSNKNAPAHLPGPVPGIVGNVTQTVNGTLPAPLPSPPSPPIPNPQNVTLVFTPVGMAIHSVNGASGVASFEPANGNGNDASDSGSNAGDDTDENDFTDASLSSSTSTSTDTDSASATTTDGPSISESSGYEYGYGYSGMPAGKADATSDATSVSASATASASGTMTESMSMSDSESSSMPTSTGSVTIDEAAMEKMYQNPRDF